MINVKMQQTPVQQLSPKIAVIGVGGGGGNAVNNMIADNLEGCDFIVCNADAQALEHSLCENKVQLGVNVTAGLGAGSKPEIGRAAAEESLEDVMQFLEGANMAFVTAGMGGGTGTGAAPVIAKACRERGILTVGVVTKPFHFEGTHRMKMAEAGIEEMQQYVDTLIVIPNQNLFRVANEKTTFADGFKMADSVLQSGVRGVTDLMVRPGLVNLDFADIRTAMLEMGKAMMGTGEASGDKRAIEAAEAAINNPLLDDVTMKGAHGVIINVTGGYDMTLFEADEACNRIRDEVDPNANIIFGATFDENMEGSMRVSIVATGIEKESDRRRRPVGSGAPVDGASKTTLERAVPNASEAPAESSSPASTPTGSYKTSIDNVRGITAPVSVAASSQSPAAPQPAPASAQPQDPSASKVAEEESDLFEQAEFTADTAHAKEQAMRGARYKDSFIPPKPMTAAAPVSFASAPARVEMDMPPATGLTLNPPRSYARPEQAQSQSPAQAPAQPARSPSFFERLAGTVQQTLDIGRAPTAAQPQRYQAPAMSSPSLSSPAPTAPSQGQLNIESPAAPAKAASDDLDIPAFLRRQAN